MPADDEYDGGPWITDLFVDPSARGHGVGRALLRLTPLTHLTASGRDRLGLAVTAGNPARASTRPSASSSRAPAGTWSPAT